MKTHLCCLLVVLGMVGAAEDERQVARKEMTLDVPAAAAKKWRLAALPYEEWLQAVTFPGWERLHASQTKDFYFAIVRAGDDLVFWHADRNDRFKAGAIGVNDANGKSAWEGPSRWATLKVNLRYPHGSVHLHGSGRRLLHSGSGEPEGAGELSRGRRRRDLSPRFPAMGAVGAKGGAGCFSLVSDAPR